MKVREDVYQEERFEYRGYPCVILFMDMGHRCGYVGVPVDVKVDEDDICCHGGITYCSGHLHGQEDEGIIWYGFDCAHCDDEQDVEATLDYFGKKPYMLSFNGSIKTLEYCKEECKKIVDQIIEMGGKKDE